MYKNKSGEKSVVERADIELTTKEDVIRSSEMEGRSEEDSSKEIPSINYALSANAWEPLISALQL